MFFFAIILLDMRTDGIVYSYYSVTQGVDGLAKRMQPMACVCMMMSPAVLATELCSTGCGWNHTLQAYSERLVTGVINV